MTSAKELIESVCEETLSVYNARRDVMMTGKIVPGPDKRTYWMPDPRFKRMFKEFPVLVYQDRMSGEWEASPVYYR